MNKTTKNKKLTILACWARQLHRGNVCYHNHSLDYGSGWFYFDDEPPFHNPDLVRQAERFLDLGITGKRHYQGMREILSLVETTTGEPIR